MVLFPIEIKYVYGWQEKFIRKRMMHIYCTFTETETQKRYFDEPSSGIQTS